MTAAIAGAPPGTRSTASTASRIGVFNTGATSPDATGADAEGVPARAAPAPNSKSRNHVGEARLTGSNMTTPAGIGRHRPSVQEILERRMRLQGLAGRLGHVRWISGAKHRQQGNLSCELDAALPPYPLIAYAPGERP